MPYKNLISRKEYHRKYRIKNRIHISHRVKARRKANPELARLQDWHHTLSKYNLTPEQYEQMLEAQNRQCAICRRNDPGDKAIKHFHVDHNHITGQVRGLLCARCNKGLGMFEENVVSLENAIAYLSYSPNQELYGRI
jgi:hypothetical protein